MATSNFWYENRCVVVTDEDYDCENLPELGDFVGSAHYHNHNTREVLTDENLYFYKVIITGGYYEHACIDYDSIESITDYRSEFEQDLDYNFRSESKRQLFDELRYSYPKLTQKYNLTKYRFVKITKGLDLYKAMDAVVVYLKEQEEKLVNKIIDGIKEDYGYIEIETYARFSNGETLYKKVS